MTKHGKFHWNELMTRDVESSKTFYGRSLGWDFESWDMPEGGTYWVAMADGEPAGGFFVMPPGPEFDGMMEHWFSYLAVDDVDARCEKAKSAGGEIMKGPWDVPGVGRVALVRDPGGAMCGWITPAETA